MISYALGIPSGIVRTRLGSVEHGLHDASPELLAQLVEVLTRAPIATCSRDVLLARLRMGLSSRSLALGHVPSIRAIAHQVETLLAPI